MLQIQTVSSEERRDWDGEMEEHNFALSLELIMAQAAARTQNPKP